MALDPRDVERDMIGRCRSLPFPLLECENISHTHAGHAGAGAHSHFRLTFQAKFASSKERLSAHQQVMRVLAPLIPHTVHSVCLVFEAG